MTRGDLFIYAETAFHHEGDAGFLRQLVDVAADVGAGGVKFQMLLEADALLARSHPSFDRLAKCVLTRVQWLETIEHAAARGLRVVVLPLDSGSFEVVNESRGRIAYLDIHSVLFHDDQLMSALRETSLPIILGVGGRTLEEIDEKVEYFGSQLSVLMVGFQAYPTRIGDVRLERIRALGERYPDLTIGYADHSAYDEDEAITSNEWAYLLGARVFEKHLALIEGADRLDKEAAVGSEKFTQICRRLLRLHDEVLPDYGPELFTHTAAERAYRDRQLVAIARRHLESGHVLGSADFSFRMAGRPGGVADAGALIGRTVARGIARDALIEVKDLQV